MEKTAIKAVTKLTSRAVTQHPLAFLFALACVPRFALATYVALVRNGALYLDDRSYLRMITERATGSSGEWDDYTKWLWNASRSFLTPGYVLFEVFGPHVLLVLLLSALLGSLLVVGTFRLMCVYASRQTSFALAAILALMPSQILWSSLYLKDIYVAVSLLLVVFLVHRFESTQVGSRLLIFSFGICVAILFISRIRVHTFLATCFAVGIALVVSRAKFRLATLGFGIVLCLFIPLIPTGQVAGLNVLTRLSNGMEEQRLAGAIGAATAVVSVDKPSENTDNGALGEQVDQEQVDQEQVDQEQVDQEQVDQEQVEEQSTLRRLLDEARYFPSGFRVMVIDPLPQDLKKSRSLYGPFAEHLIWYPILVLAAVGICSLRRRTPTYVTELLLLGGLIAMWGLIEGNFGTAFRHRTEFVWLVFVFGAGGLDSLKSSLRKRGPQQR
jgi:hypothetical protein